MRDTIAEPITPPPMTPNLTDINYYLQLRKGSKPVAVAINKGHKFIELRGSVRCPMWRQIDESDCSQLSEVLVVGSPHHEGHC